MRQITLSTLLLLFAQIALAQYQPKATGELVIHTDYSLDYNEDHEQPNWVYYSITPENTTGEAERSNSFRADPKVSTGSAATADYTKSGYDRGHLCPAADMSYSAEAMRETFYMSNMSPQAPSFNRGGWKKLEELVREWCTAEGELHVTTAAILSDDDPKIGKNGVSVPARYYKVVYAPKSQKMIAFVMPNEKLLLPIESYATTTDEVEALTNIDLYPQLDDTLETKLESSVELSNWTF